jgi:hypothetical protein
MNRGNFIRGMNGQRLNGLADLPGALSTERGESDQPAPFGQPPNASLYAPPSPGAAAVQRLDPTLQSNWAAITFVAGLVPIRIQDFLARKFFLIQNKSGIGTIFVGFGYQPTVDNGLVLDPGVGYEPFRYPVNDIWVAASVAGTKGVLIYGT